MLLLRRKAILLGGDTAALLAFAAIGRSNHGESLDVGSILSVAWPFLAGVFSAALVCTILPSTLVMRDDIGRGELHGYHPMFMQRVPLQAV